MKKLLSVFLAILLVLCSAGCSANAGTTFDDAMEAGNMNQTALVPVSTQRPGYAPQDPEYTFGNTFSFLGLEITIGSDVSLTEVSDMTSEHYKKSVLSVPVTIKNISDKNSGLNVPFYLTFYGPTGAYAEYAGAHFRSDVSNIGTLSPGSEVDSAFHIIYEGTGDYYIEFMDWVNTIIVKIPVNK